MNKHYDEKRTEKLDISELKVIPNKGDEYNFYTENAKMRPTEGMHGCIGATFENKDYKWRHYYDIIPTNLQNMPPKEKSEYPYIIHLRYRKQRFLCHECKKPAEISISFAAEHAHYTVRFEKWIAQLCIKNSFADVEKLVRGITPPPSTEADKHDAKLISERGIEKSFMRWVSRENKIYLDSLYAPDMLGIHVTSLRGKCYYLLTNLSAEVKNKDASTVIWMAQDLKEIKELLGHMYGPRRFPTHVLVDWTPGEELIALAEKQFTSKTEIVIDYKRLPKYISENISENIPVGWLELSIETLKEHPYEKNKEFVWGEIKAVLSIPDCSALSKYKLQLKNSIWPSLIETDDDYWHHIDNITDLMLNANDYGCSAEALRACILYAYKCPYDEEADNYIKTHVDCNMSASYAALYLSFMGLNDRKQVLPRQHYSLFTNEPYDPLINCLYDKKNNENYGVPLETAKKNLYSVIRYHQAYEYYLAHQEETSRIMESTLYDD